MTKTIRWRWGVIAAVGITLLSLLPQVYLWRDRGHEWNGGQAFIYADETIYAAYLNAIIDGSPRRNDPFTGISDTPSAPLYESQFSIQFTTAYLLAIPARAFNLSTATVFILLAPLVAFTTSLALFWFFALLTEDDRAAAAFVPFVLCLGLLLSGNGLVCAFLGLPTNYSYFPFMRRYMPGGNFPWFMLFFPCLWLALVSKSRRRRICFAVAAGVAFAACVFGYFYLWTAALAWLALVVLLWLVAKPEGWREALKSCALVVVMALAALMPYAVLLSDRGPALEKAHALVYTRSPDPWRSIEVLGLLIILALVAAWWRGRVSWRDPRILLTVALALLPFVLFNQQIITGRSLQPMHYEQFVASYTTLIAAALTMTWLWRGRSERRLSWRPLLLIACLSYGWGWGEALISTRRFAQVNIIRDEARPVALRLRELAREESANPQQPPDVVFSPSFARSDHLPMVAPQAVLWAPHMFCFSTFASAEYKQRFFKFLYYSGVSAAQFEREYLNQKDVRDAVFGWERSNPNLTVAFKPITNEELGDAAREYEAYAASFDRLRATQPTLSYLMLKADERIDLANLDRWYTRDEGEHIGSYRLYRLQLRTDNQ